MKSAITLRLSADKTTIDLNEPIIIKITATNNSDEFVSLPGSIYEITAVNESGNQIRNTARGSERKKHSHDAMTLNVTPLLRPGEKNVDEETISSMFNIDRPGIYFVKVSQDISGSTGQDTLQSNDLKLIVK